MCCSAGFKTLFKKMCKIIFINEKLQKKCFKISLCFFFFKFWFGVTSCDINASHFYILRIFLLWSDHNYSSHAFHGVALSSENCNSAVHFFCAVLSQLLSCALLFVTPRTEARQAVVFLEFFRQEYWCGLPFPPPEDLPNAGIDLLGLLHWQADSLPLGRSFIFS